MNYLSIINWYGLIKTVVNTRITILMTSASNYQSLIGICLLKANTGTFTRKWERISILLTISVAFYLPYGHPTQEESALSATLIAGMVVVIPCAALAAVVFGSCLFRDLPQVAY